MPSGQAPIHKVTVSRYEAHHVPLCTLRFWRFASQGPWVNQPKPLQGQKLSLQKISNRRKAIVFHQLRGQITSLQTQGLLNTIACGSIPRKCCTPTDRLKACIVSVNRGAGTPPVTRCKSCDIVGIEQSPYQEVQSTYTSDQAIPSRMSDSEATNSVAPVARIILESTSDPAEITSTRPGCM